MDIDNEEEDVGFLDTVEGEIALFRSIMRARPVGIHRHFHALTIRNAILRDTGEDVTISEIWEKLRSCYDLDILESIEVDGYDPPGEVRSPGILVRSPSPSENLSLHPFFRQEFSLPQGDSFDAMMSDRRMRASTSLPSSPAASPSQLRGTKSVRPTKKSKPKTRNMAGLVGGDSDSSALTQESGDDSVAPTPKSVVTGTDAGTEYAEDDDEGSHNSPAPSGSLKSTRKTVKTIKKGTTAGRARATSGSATRGTKKKKK